MSVWRACFERSGGMLYPLLTGLMLVGAVLYWGIVLDTGAVTIAGTQLTLQTWRCMRLLERFLAERYPQTV